MSSGDLAVFGGSVIVLIIWSYYVYQEGRANERARHYRFVDAAMSFRKEVVETIEHCCEDASKEFNANNGCSPDFQAGWSCGREETADELKYALAKTFDAAFAKEDRDT